MLTHQKIIIAQHMVTTVLVVEDLVNFRCFLVFSLVLMFSLMLVLHIRLSIHYTLYHDLWGIIHLVVLGVELTQK